MLSTGSIAECVMFNNSVVTYNDSVLLGEVLRQVYLGGQFLQTAYQFV